MLFLGSVNAGLRGFFYAFLSKTMQKQHQNNVKNNLKQPQNKQ